MIRILITAYVQLRYLRVVMSLAFNRIIVVINVICNLAILMLQRITLCEQPSQLINQINNWQSSYYYTNGNGVMFELCKLLHN